jgi:hypothetical protein
MENFSDDLGCIEDVLVNTPRLSINISENCLLSNKGYVKRRDAETFRERVRKSKSSDSCIPLITFGSSWDEILPAKNEVYGIYKKNVTQDYNMGKNEEYDSKYSGFSPWSLNELPDVPCMKRKFSEHAWRQSSIEMMAELLK